MIRRYEINLTSNTCHFKSEILFYIKFKFTFYFYFFEICIVFIFLSPPKYAFVLNSYFKIKIISLRRCVKWGSQQGVFDPARAQFLSNQKTAHETQSSRIICCRVSCAEELCWLPMTSNKNKNKNKIQK